MTATRGLLVALLLVALTAGCGGGGGETATPPAPAETSPPAAPPAETGTPPAESAAPEPNFGLEDELFLPMAQLKQAMDEGAHMIIVDSRVPEAWAQDHITGAISIPFYEIDERYSELPKDTWIVAYCSCPTAEAQAAVEVLRSKGYTKTAVLLEGYPAWQDAGYPTTTGTGA